MAIMTLNFESGFLKMNTDVNVIMPDKGRRQSPREFYVPGRKFPVLWLLHGGRGDRSDWLRKTNIETYACERGLIVVMPSAYNSYYGKWPRAFGGLDAADYFTEELMPLIYAWLPASQAREDNFIAGLSMGGQGAIKFCAGHPEKFAACAMLSAAALDYEELYRAEQQGPDHAHADYVDANGGIEKFMAGEENTRGVLRDLGASGRAGELPPIYMEAGDRDRHFQEFEAFAGFMKELGIPVRLNISEGYGHEWRFWDIGIQHALDFFEGISPKLGAERKGRD